MPAASLVLSAAVALVQPSQPLGWVVCRESKVSNFLLSKCNCLLLKWYQGMILVLKGSGWHKMLPCICVMTTSLAPSVTAARLSPLERMCANRSVLTFVPTLVLGQSGSKAHITAGFAPMPGVFLDMWHWYRAGTTCLSQIPKGKQDLVL